MRKNICCGRFFRTDFQEARFERRLHFRRTGSGGKSLCGLLRKNSLADEHFRTTEVLRGLPERVWNDEIVRFDPEEEKRAFFE